MCHHQTRVHIGLLAFAAASLLVGTASAQTEVVRYPTADVWVQKGGSGGDLGGQSNTLEVEPQNNHWSYLRFSLSGLSGTIESCTLELFAQGSFVAEAFAIECLTTSDSWDEGAVTGLTAPDPTSGPLAHGQPDPGVAYLTAWSSEELSQALRQENGEVSFILRDTRSVYSRRVFHSRDSRVEKRRPRLRIVLAAQPSTPTPTATSTLSPTLTVTPAPTMTLTSTVTPSMTLTPSPTATATASPSPTASPMPSATATPTPEGKVTASPTPTFDPYDLSGDGVVRPEDLFYLSIEGVYQEQGRDEIYVLQLLEKIRSRAY